MSCLGWEPAVISPWFYIPLYLSRCHSSLPALEVPFLFQKLSSILQLPGPGAPWTRVGLCLILQQALACALLSISSTTVYSPCRIRGYAFWGTLILPSGLMILFTHLTIPRMLLLFQGTYSDIIETWLLYKGTVLP